MVMEPVTPERVAPIIIGPKKDSSLCPLRRLPGTKLRRHSRFSPLPRIDECVDSMGEVKVRLTLDANTGCWQIEIDERDRKNTAFTSHHSL